MHVDYITSIKTNFAKLSISIVLLWHHEVVCVCVRWWRLTVWCNKRWHMETRLESLWWTLNLHSFTDGLWNPESGGAYHWGGGVTATQLEGDLQEINHQRISKLTSVHIKSIVKYKTTMSECSIARHPCTPDANETCPHLANLNCTWILNTCKPGGVGWVQRACWTTTLLC